MTSELSVGDVVLSGGEALTDGAMQLRDQRRYRHRLSATGEPLHYVAIVAEKAR